ncbi:hypothetical protein [Thalassotalea eurytherma]|uniref:Uncharacterized protein n=1 Tax=Thalassotalea eurytherma TaxID=1144278 RepID=A0ABQ6GZA6_9GAMM|nr:hypothetical protein [Thalassotalea eurytherma]GLX81192.1 hypothetical protein theurythT_06440 [Thalassotalea eurytherma]
MSALLKESKRITKDINLVYDFTEKTNLTQLQAQPDRAVVAKLRADLVLPNDKILTVDIDFDTTSGYHDNTMMIMDDFGVEMLTAAFAVKYGESYAQSIQKAWQEKQDPNDPRKPTYMLVQKPENEGELPKVYCACGSKQHPPQEAPENIV